MLETFILNGHAIKVSFLHGIFQNEITFFPAHP